MVLKAQENTLNDYNGQAIFDKPLIGIADGDDAVFSVFRAVVSNCHLIPRDILRRHSPKHSDLTQVRVISWALPFTTAIRRTNRVNRGPSQLYSLARNNGEALNHEMRRRLAEYLRGNGNAAVAPILT